MESEAPEAAPKVWVCPNCRRRFHSLRGINNHKCDRHAKRRSKKRVHYQGVLDDVLGLDLEL